jgi:hypothetical protein
VLRTGEYQRQTWTPAAALLFWSLPFWDALHLHLKPTSHTRVAGCSYTHNKNNEILTLVAETSEPTKAKMKSKNTESRQRVSLLRRTKHAHAQAAIYRFVKARATAEKASAGDTGSTL